MRVCPSVCPSVRLSVCPLTLGKKRQNCPKSSGMNHIQDIQRYSNKINTQRTHRCPIGLVFKGAVPSLYERCFYFLGLGVASFVPALTGFVHPLLFFSASYLGALCFLSRALTTCDQRFESIRFSTLLGQPRHKGTQFAAHVALYLCISAIFDIPSPARPMHPLRGGQKSQRVD